MINSKYVDMKNYSYFKIPLYLKYIGWETFVTLDTNFIYPRFIRIFFANFVIDEDIPTITSFVKGKMIIINEQYLSKWLNLSLLGLRVFSGNKLVTVLPSLTKEVQLATVFGDDYIDCEFLPPHNYLFKESHFLQYMLTQVIIPRTGQKSKMLYKDLFMIVSILK